MVIVWKILSIIQAKVENWAFENAYFGTND